MPKPTKVDLSGRERNTRPVMRLMEERGGYELARLNYDYEQIAPEHREIVRRAAVEIRGRLKRTVEDMIEIGKALNEVQELLGWGQFYEWAQGEFGMSRGSIFEYSRIATRFEPIRSNFERILPSTVRRLALPSVPDEAVEAVIAAAEGRDKPLPYKEAMAIVKPYLPVKPPKPKRLPPPPEPEVIEAEYTVVDAPVMLQLPRNVAEELEAAILIGALGRYVTADSVQQLKLVLKEALT